MKASTARALFIVLLILLFTHSTSIYADTPAPSLFNGEIVGMVLIEATLAPLARTDGWFNVEYQGADGWISADYVVTQGDCG